MKNLFVFLYILFFSHIIGFYSKPYKYAGVCIYMCVCVCVCIYIYICVCVCVCVCLYMYVCVHIYVCMCMYIYIYIYTDYMYSSNSPVNEYGGRVWVGGSAVG